MRVAAAAAVSATPASSGVTGPPLLPFRVGHGFDLHRLAEGYKLIIGGIDIPHTKGCEAHSDGELLGCEMFKASNRLSGRQVADPGHHLNLAPCAPLWTPTGYAKDLPASLSG